MIYYISKANQKLIDLLIKKGANIEAKDKDGFTPLIIAAQDGKSSIRKRNYLKVKLRYNLKVNDKICSIGR